MQPVQFDHLLNIGDNFSQWIRPLNFLPALPANNRETFLFELEGDERNEAERIYEFREVTRWRAIRDTIAKIADDFIGNERYLAELYGLKDEAIHNAFNLESGDDRRQFYQQQLCELLTQLRKSEVQEECIEIIETVGELEICWEGDGTQFSRKHFEQVAFSFPPTSPYSDEVISYFNHICFYVINIIENIKKVLNILERVIKVYFKVTILGSATLVPDGKQIKLSHVQIAILYHICDWPIKDYTSNEIARKYEQTSGQKLLATYNQLTSELTRTGRGRNRVNDYLAISSLVPIKHKAKYDKELKDAEGNNKK